MRLVTFRRPGQRGPAVGALDVGGWVRDLGAVEPAIPQTMLALIRGGAEMLALAQRALASAPVVQDAVLMAPIPKPAKNIFCVGKNYHEHAKEFAGSGFDATASEVVPEFPVVFSKPPTSVIGPGQPIPSAMDPTNSVDYEGEVAVVIGRRGRGITKFEALGHVFGYTIVNDVTARTLQQRHRQWLLGKGLDGFCPMGPAILTVDEMPDPRAMHITTQVNGEQRQSAPVSDLIFDIPALIEAISAGITLEPGDIIATGTPVGVGIGFKPPVFLKTGDVVRIEVPGIGVLENPVG
jgi:2-keto-4-pentenoate hydratase/2-oxohepta-3-ene-1,7-dioic acid hydratase in catechol pathway